MAPERLIEEIKTSALNRDSLEATPMQQFALWMQQAQNAGIKYPHAMSLATASANGEVSSRVVLLRYFDSDGFVFYSGYDTLKSFQIAENKNVSLLFPWLDLERQVKISGIAEKIPPIESLKFFTSRSKENQIDAWLTQSSGIISSKSVLLGKLEGLRRKFKEGQIPLPGAWGGYKVRPKYVEFWQGRQNGLHDRFLYSVLEDLSWKIERLSP